MANLLSDAEAWLAGQLQTHVATTVTYRRGGAAVSLAATKGRTEFEQIDENGFAQRILSIDFLLPAADLILSGAVTLPARGDTIEETIGSATHTHEVLPIGTEPCYRLTGANRKQLRIHTKQKTVA